MTQPAPEATERERHPELSENIGHLISRLKETREGSKDLDMEIFWIEFPCYERGKTPITHCLDYTTSLDAKLEGENIVMVQFGYWKEGKGWQATHADKSKNPTVVYAHTEPLARRAAALEALKARLGDG